jgi:hypothetical protein
MRFACPLELIMLNVVRVRQWVLPAGLLMAILLAALVMPATANAASTSAIEAAHTAVAPAAAVVQLKHLCTSGTDSVGHFSVICADIDAQEVAGGWQVWGVGEFICENSAHAIVTCPGIDGETKFCIAAVRCVPLADGKCGSLGGNPCKPGRVTITSQRIFIPYHACASVQNGVIGSFILPGGRGNVDSVVSTAPVSCT